MTLDSSTIMDLVNGLVVPVLGYGVWTMKRLITKVDGLIVDVAVLKKTAEDTKEDHDRVVILEQQSKAAHRRLDDINRMHGS